MFDPHEHGDVGDGDTSGDAVRLGAAGHGVRPGVSLLLRLHLGRRHHHHSDAGTQCTSRRLGQIVIVRCTATRKGSDVDWR